MAVMTVVEMDYLLVGNLVGLSVGLLVSILVVELVDWRGLK